MRVAVAFLLVLSACSSSAATPDGACSASDRSCDPGSPAKDSGAATDASAAAPEAGKEAATPIVSDASSAWVPDVACGLWVDDAGVTQGCGEGDMGPGDRDDGGGAPPPPPPDASLDASDLGFGASCWDNPQCASNLCFDFKARGQFCSQICTIDQDCPLPSPGCNGMGVCRMPGGM
jgi:hypothetical protein